MGKLSREKREVRERGEVPLPQAQVAAVLKAAAPPAVTEVKAVPKEDTFSRAVIELVRRVNAGHDSTIPSLFVVGEAVEPYGRYREKW